MFRFLVSGAPMRQQTITTIATYAVLLLAGAMPFTMPDQLGGEGSALAGMPEQSLVATTPNGADNGERSLRGDVATADFARHDLSQ
jgi:hypothetical protein